MPDVTRTVLCYGDSLFWGWNPDDRTRYRWSERLPAIVENTLGGGWRVIDNALPGRTVCSDDPFLPRRNGLADFEMILEAHMPLDWIVIGLGINDLKRYFPYTAIETVAALRRYHERVLRVAAVAGVAAPRELFVGLTDIGQVAGGARAFEARRDDVSHHNTELASLAASIGARYLDPRPLVEDPGADGIHWSRETTAAIARAVAGLIRESPGA